MKKLGILLFFGFIGFALFVRSAFTDQRYSQPKPRNAVNVLTNNEVAQTLSDLKAQSEKN